jgi:hypothetical protein
MPEKPQVLTNNAAATRLRTLLTRLTHEEPAPAIRVTLEKHPLPSHHRHHDDHPEAA